ncbi:MAG: RluA family pseudouridine synthase [Clostridia bacterium]|nr:RluA family pseudouridine synthase [Clostridia bacterium]
MDFLIEEKHSGITVKEYIRSELGLSTRTLSGLKNDERGITLNGERVTVRAILRAGDVLSLATEDKADDVNADIVPEDIHVGILYEDEYVIVADKPGGMATHPSYNHRSGTLANALAYYFESQGKPFVFRAVNRLDLEASGAVMVAKDRDSSYKYNTAMRLGKIDKAYTALLSGIPDPEKGSVESYISRLREGVVIRRSLPEGKESEYALTEYRVIEKANGFSLVRAVPVTGRTHQLRVHFSSLGMPILGDVMYGGESGLIGRTALHSTSLAFDRISVGASVRVSSPLPDDIRSAWETVKCQ